MKTINKKYILAGLLMAAAMAPARTECFSPALKTQADLERFWENYKLLSVTLAIMAGGTGLTVGIFNNLFPTHKTKFFTISERTGKALTCKNDPDATVQEMKNTKYEKSLKNGSVQLVYPIEVSYGNSCDKLKSCKCSKCPYLIKE